jgi:WD40 repeat protein
MLYFDNDDQEIISTDRHFQVCVTRLELKTKNCRSIQEFVGDSGALFPSPDGSVWASRTKEGIVRLWNGHSLTPVGEPFSEPVNPTQEITFSSDSQMLGAACETMSTAICLWNVGSTSAPIKVVVGSAGIANLAFNPARSIIAAGSWDSLIRLWDITPTLKYREPRRGHIGPVLKVLFSPDGKILSSWSERERIIRLWDVDGSGVFDTVLRGNQANITSMVFSSDSTSLVSGADDGSIVLWNLSESSWRETACRMSNRNLTREEWKTYVGDSKPYELLCQL